MKKQILLWLMVLSAAAAARDEADPPLGRLFYSAEQRARIDAGPEGPAPMPPRVRKLDGILRSSDGASTIWLDGEALRGAQKGISIGTDRIRIRTESGRSVEIRVGTTGRLR
ncbi:hypothetical protein [Niveibacterium terrae]|uniref:hypothetical protein n=1 Tax=Niveibacterium terrae TaxID=3373598 RepID=UPI003A94BDA3